MVPGEMESESQELRQLPVGESEFSEELTDEELAWREKTSQESRQKVDEYATANLSPLLLKFAIPAIVGMLCQGVQNIVNRIFVGRACGSLALAGVQIGFPVTTLFMALAMLIGMGSMTLISIRLGQNRRDDAERLLGQAALLLFAIPLLMCIPVLPVLDPVLRFIGASNAVLPYARDYFQVLLISMIFFSMSAGLNNIIRAQGAPNVAMGTQILASILNVAFNYAFVIVLGWGVRGAALGILLGNFFSLFWIFGFFAKKSSYIHVRLRYLRLFPHELRTVLTLGVAPFLIQCANCIQQFFMNARLGMYGGDPAIAALSVCMTLSTLLLLPLIGFSQGSMPIMGYNYGAGNFERIKGTLFRAIGFGSIFGLISWLAVMFGADFMAGLFITDEPEVAALAAHALHIFFCCLIFVPLGVCGGALFQSCGKVKASMFLSMARQVIFFIPLLFILPPFVGLDGCWLAAPLSDVLAAVVTGYFVFFGLRSIKIEMETKGVGDLVK